ncbi:MAG: ABC transporter ATP-binding protein [Pseudomonadota bacterium]
MADQQPLLEAQNITKLFGEFAANRDVSIKIIPGERHALLGENGAGKSTLVKMMYGVMQPTEGLIYWQASKTRIPSPAAARSMGIGMVFQHFSVFEALTVAENIALALPPERMSALSKRIAEVSERYGLAIEPGRAMHTLSVGEKQRVEIIRCLLQNPRLLIMDEPTSVLTPQETLALFKTLRQLSEDGCAILYISHKLAEVIALCDTATILRHGENVTTCDPKTETPKSMAEMMVGDQIDRVEKAGTPMTGRARLAVKNLSLPASSDLGVALKDISLEARAGEVTAIAGIAGEGQSELMAALTGEVLAPAETVLIDDEPMGCKGPTARRLAGAAFVPEERQGHAAIGAMSLSENIVLSHHQAEGLARGGFVDQVKTRSWVDKTRQDFDVRAAGEDPPAGSLSGGNLQKFVVGREILRNPGVLIVNQPTWGVDAGAAALIRQRLIDLAWDHAAVLVISQDLEEIFAIANRIAVIYQGRLSPIYPIEEITPEQVGLLMAGEEIPGKAA